MDEGTMEGRYPNGLMVAVTSCNDPSNTEEFHNWYKLEVPPENMIVMFEEACECGPHTLKTE